LRLSPVADIARQAPAFSAPDGATLAGWPLNKKLSAVDLDLENRDRVSALPWRGQFSPLTVERLLSALAPRGSTVLDPFVGSGTTLIETARRGHPAIGLDINPAAIAFARCAALASYSLKQRVRRLDVATGAAFGGAQSILESQGIDIAHGLALLEHITGSRTAARRRIDALIATLPDAPVPTEAHLGDARATGIENGSIDFIVTSPPYINVFNYHQYGRPLTDSFGWPVLTAARSEIGSNRQNRGNRFKTVVQYSIDMALVLLEMSRVLAKDSTAVLVLGRESRVRGVPFLNGEILARLAVGLDVFRIRDRASRCFVNRFGQSIYEDVLVLGASRWTGLGEADASDVGRTVGVQALRECQVTPDTHAEIATAIDDSPGVAASTISGAL
jgi:16S rRNA G966 N2-methylase RsmD